jgi:hypothetical protein
MASTLARARAPVQLRNAAQPLPGQGRFGLVEPGILERGAILGRPMFPAKLAQACHQALRKLAQVKDIVGGVFQLRGTQGPLRPIRPRLTFGDGDVQQGLDQLGIADLRLEPDAACGDLGIEHGRDTRFWADKRPRDPGGA